MPEIPPTSANGAVFLSYASQDAEAAKRICEGLRAAGIAVWFDQNELRGGDAWDQSIRRQIKDCALFVPLISANTQARGEGYFRLEWKLAVDRSHLLADDQAFLLPVVLDDTAEATARIPDRFRERHWERLRNGEIPSDFAQRVLGLLRGAVSPGPAGAAGTMPGVRRAGPKPPPGTNSIAVLPFANMSADKDQEYFSDGLAEEIINLLAHIPGLKVIARTSAFAFRGKEQDIRQIAAALGVTHVLEGSVRRAGDRLRVTGQLIHAGDGMHLWSERYDRELSDIFAIQDEIAAAIVGALKVKLAAAPPRYVPNLAAYEAYLKAKHLAINVTPESLELAKRCYEQAAELDDNFPLPHIGLGCYWVSVMIFGGRPAHEAVPAARAAARRALQLDASLPEAHALLGLLAALYDFDWAAAERHFDQPAAKQASFTTFRPMFGWVEFMRGNTEHAIILARRAVEEDPLDLWPRMNLHAYFQDVGREGDALEQLQKVLEIDPHQMVALVSMAMIVAHRGDLKDALKIARRAYAIAPWYPDAIAVLAALTRREGAVAESHSLTQALGAGATAGGATVHALFHLLCGEVDLGADWAEKAIKERDLTITLYLRFVVAKELRASHRWPAIAKLMNLPG